MSQAALDALVMRGEALVAALDADDVVVVEGAVAALRDALEAARGITPAGGLAVRAREAFALIEAARVRVAFLSDLTRGRLRRLAAATGRDTPAVIYGRHGQPC